MMKSARSIRAACGVAFAICATTGARGQEKMAQTIQQSVIPTVGEVELNLPAGAPADIRERMTRIYEYVRTRLIAADIGYPVVANVLGSMTRNGRADFARSEFRYAAWRNSRPSALAHLCWRDALLGIADDAERKFNPPVGERAPALAGKDEEIILDAPRRDNGLFQRVVAALRGSMKGLGDVKLSCAESGLASLPGVYRWRHPVRIAATGNSNTDARIRAAIADIRKRAPSAPIDSQTFPAPAASANLLFGAPGSGATYFALDTALQRCISAPGCSNVAQLAGSATVSSRVARYISTREFLAHGYFSRPYPVNLGGPIAFVEVSSGDEIVGALCGFEDRDADDVLEQVNVTSCLAQALGAYLTDEKTAPGYNLEQERSLMADALSDLDNLYGPGETL